MLRTPFYYHSDGETCPSSSAGALQGVKDRPRSIRTAAQCGTTRSVL